MEEVWDAESSTGLQVEGAAQGRWSREKLALPKSMSMATAAAGESEIALALPTLYVNENNYFM